MLRDCVSEPHGFELLVFEREFGVELVVDVVDGAGLALRVQVSLLERRDPLLLVLALRHRLHPHNIYTSVTFTQQSRS